MKLIRPRCRHSTTASEDTHSQQQAPGTFATTYHANLAPNTPKHHRIDDTTRRAR